MEASSNFAIFTPIRLSSGPQVVPALTWISLAGYFRVTASTQVQRPSSPRTNESVIRFCMASVPAQLALHALHHLSDVDTLVVGFAGLPEVVCHKSSGS